MRFCKVSELLAWVSTYHQTLAQKYMVLANETTKERAALLLKYLSEHQQRLADSVGQYAEEAADTLMASWSDQCPEFEIPDSVTQLHISLADKDTDEIIRNVIEFHNQLIEMYKMLEDKATNPSVKALFESLAKMEQQEEMRTVRDAQRLEDY
jgi:rubrerythrin